MLKSVKIKFFFWEFQDTAGDKSTFYLWIVFLQSLKKIQKFIV